MCAFPACVLSILSLLIIRCVSSQQIRPFLNGSGNNPTYPSWGASGLPFGNFVQISQLSNVSVNVVPLDDIGSPALEVSLGIPSARLVSNVVARVPGDPEPASGPTSLLGISEFTTYFGEFVAQDIGHVSGTQIASDKANILIPSTEAGTPNRTIPFVRAIFQTSTNITISSFSAQKRTPISFTTSFMDASMIYGVDSQLLASRRDRYKFNMSTITLSNGASVSMPPLWNNYNKAVEFSVVNNLTDPNPLFLFGAMGGNTSPNSQGLHILFMREHNRRADEIKKNNTGFSDDEVFEKARAWVIALVQQITYYEYLPVVLGESLPKYNGYNLSVNPVADTFFSSCAFRYGHSEISSVVLQSKTPNSDEKTYLIEDTLMNITLVRKFGISPFLIGMSKTIQQDPDVYVTRALRNTLFKGNPIDLFANDIQRTRDFGLPSYTQVRKLYGLSVPANFSELTLNTTISSNIQSVYKDINLVDALIGGLAEVRSAASNVGPLFKAALVNQFVAIRAGDRFWFENAGVLPTDMLAQVKSQTMRNLIVLHTKDEFSTSSEDLLNKDIWHSTSSRSLPYAIPAGFVTIFNDANFVISSKVPSSGSNVTIDIQCSSQGGWCGFGFGASMSVAEFVIARPVKAQNGVINVVVEEYVTQNYQARPKLRTDGGKSISIQSSKYNDADNIMTFQFTRNATGNKNMINLSRQEIIFANVPFVSTFSSDATTVSDWFVQHTGLVVICTYEPSWSGTSPLWWTHLVIGFILIFLVICVALFGSFVKWFKNAPHKLRNSLKLSHHWLARIPFIGIYKYFPLNAANSTPAFLGWWITYFVLLDSKKQLFIPINNHSNLTTDELLGSRNLQSFSEDNPNRLLLTPVNSDSQTSFPLPPKSNLIPAEITPQSQALLSSRKFTWKSLSDAIDNGELLVVGSGRFVYDISSWITIHPGGPAILNAVAAFDKDEFVMKSEIDDIYSPKIANLNTAWISKLKPTSSIGQSSISIASSSPTEGDSTIIMEKVNEIRRSFIRPNDWKMVQKARRLHQHSKMAGEKILSMFVGEITSDGVIETDVNLSTENPAFDIYEYRRYALTSKKLVSLPNSKSPVYLCKFVLLFPFSQRENEPKEEFASGQSVEIQIQNDSKKFVSRYYTPISGTIKSFEVMIKVVRTGELTPVFEKPDRTLLGVKQFKIRGPFGKPLIPISVWSNEVIQHKLEVLSKVPTMVSLDQKQLTILSGWRDPRTTKIGYISRTSSTNIAFSNEFLLNRWTRLLFIAAGSGLAPCLQILKDHFLPENKVVYAYSEVVPKGPSDLAMSAGDAILAMKQYLDGWAHGLNVRTGTEGVFPMAATVPLCGVKELTNAKFRLVNCVHTESDLFGEEILAGAALASTGGILQVSHVVAAPSGQADNYISDPKYERKIYAGRLELGMLKHVLEDFEDELEPHIIVCGPAAFERDVYTYLIDEIGVDHRDITMLPPNAV
ncbi:Peroxidase mlt-7 [Nowakowskiella sp. JEL0078]|nr:Peroxidase mlt-7 [Nowakowskiella sp. JEL0078]